MAPHKSRAIFKKDLSMYVKKDRLTKPLFEDLFPFGGKLDENNKWLKLAELIPWDALELEYSRYFSNTGRPAKDARLVIGLLVLKHMKNISDEDIVQEVRENPYLQAFCGYENFTSGKLLDPSTLTYVRKRLGPENFEKLEDIIYKALLDRKLISPKGMFIDATVSPENIRFPTDVGILNEAREWAAEQVKSIGKQIGKRYRTYCRVAKKTYLAFSKRKRRTKKVIRCATKSMLQYLRRNISQLEEAMKKASELNITISHKVWHRIRVVNEMYRQQKEMYRAKVNKIADRIVSISRPWVRPIKRGKLGKDTEFGPKLNICYVDGYVFIDRFSTDNFNESTDLKQQIRNFIARFGHKPPFVVGDQIYGTRWNRKFLKRCGIRDAFVPLGRKAKAERSSDRWRRQKQRERNRIEGSFGHMKNHLGFDRILYYMDGGDELWSKLTLLASNLSTAVKRI